MTSLRRRLKVFLCHASGDKPQVRALYDRLIADGVDAWLDQEDLLPGQDWRVEIPKAVREADAVVICLSNKSITKEGYIQKEIKFALDSAEEKPAGSIFLIPARLEECVVPESLSRWQWVDFFSEDGYERLIMALQSRAKNVDATLPKKSLTVEKKSQERVLEAAIRNQIRVGKPAPLFVRIRHLESKSIISVISEVDEDIVLDEDDVKSKGLEIEFPIENGRMLPASISLRLIAHEFNPAVQEKRIHIPPAGDSELCTFTVTPMRTGKLLLSLEVLSDEVSLVTRTLRTTAIKSGQEERIPLILVSLPIVVFVQASTSITGSIFNSESEEKRKTKIEVGRASHVESVVDKPATREEDKTWHHAGPQSGSIGPKEGPLRPRRRLSVEIQVALVAAAATIMAALIGIGPTIFKFFQNTPIPASPTPFCMSPDDILVKVHVLRSNNTEITTLTPGATFYIEPGLTVYFQVELISVNGIDLPSPECSWKNTGNATDGKLLHDAGCRIDYQGGLKNITDSISLQLSQPACLALPPYPFFIASQQ